MKINSNQRSLLIVSCFVVTLTLQQSVQAQTTRKKTVMRVFWQDRESEKLSYADLSTTDKWHIKRGWVKDFPAIDAKTHNLGPMAQHGSALMVAINGVAGADSTKGLVAIDSGVFEEPHGNHFHWKYVSSPSTKLTNPTPANVFDSFVFDNKVYFCHAGGFVQVDPGKLKNAGPNNIVRTHVGGGAEPVLAPVSSTSGFAFWNDIDGENAGRVDIVNLAVSAEQIPPSFKIPLGGITAAIANSGKVIFAHGIGISWFASNMTLPSTGQSPDVREVADVDGRVESDQRSSFVNERNWVLYSVNSSEESALCMIDAASTNPRVIKLPIELEDGLFLSNPKTKLSLGKRFAFIFQEKSRPDSNAKEKLSIIDLDPNRDMNFSDAVVKSILPIGASKIDGIYGHHHICFDAYGRFAVFTNPGDGILTIMTLTDSKVRARFRVGGTPEKIVAVGAPEHFH